MRAGGGTITIEKMRLDEAGFPQPTGEFEELAADSVVLALGQEADLSLLDGVPGVELADGTVRVGPDLMTGCPGVFAGGDMIPAERTATVATGHGHRAARSIDAWRRGSVAPPPGRPALAGFDSLNTWHYSDAPATVRPELEEARRVSTSDVVTGGLTAANVVYEARRCLSCGNCFECDNCYGSGPDNAVIKLGPGHRYAMDLDSARAAASARPSARAARLAWCPSRADQPAMRPALAPATAGSPRSRPADPPGLGRRSRPAPTFAPAAAGRPPVK